MIFIRSKQRRLRLATSEHDELRQQVLRRDGWRCQLCGEKRNLEVHHKKLRSHCGDDAERNLITLCNACHRQVHWQEMSAILAVLSDPTSKGGVGELWPEDPNSPRFFP